MNRCCHCDTTEVEGEDGTTTPNAINRGNQQRKIMPSSNQQDNDDAGAGSSFTGHASYRTIAVGGSNSRTVSYTIIEAKEQQQDRSTAIILFYPLSGASMTISKMQLNDYSCSLICVDRPSCYGTSPLLLDSDDNDDDDYDNDLKKNSKDLIFLKRIRGSVKDALAVLAKEKITTIYILGVCIGHPYAVELCRQCLPPSSSSTTPTTSKVPVVGGMTLVAPFVSTACPSSWKVARFGASWWLPSSLLWGATEMAPIAEKVVVPFLSSRTIESLLSTDEEREVWTSQQDFEDAYQMLLDLTPITKNAKGIEARLGVSKIWQTKVCDKFAKESGLALEDCDCDDTNAEKSEDYQSKTSTSSCTIPIRIHASREDKLASLSSVEWISKRCYGNAPIIIEETIHSHEVMTFLGGPPCNPVLLHKIATDWGLLTSTSIESEGNR
mmetsp:Transcript_55000/g.133575  ORF Transcript_55000/g.133575 Transcript_55000/m.133575 type:complete len:439 (+) Transcript_55000:111-1427(+)